MQVGFYKAVAQLAVYSFVFHHHKNVKLISIFNFKSVNGQDGELIPNLSYFCVYRQSPSYLLLHSHVQHYWKPLLPVALAFMSRLLPTIYQQDKALPRTTRRFKKQSTELPIEMRSPSKRRIRQCNSFIKSLLFHVVKYTSTGYFLIHYLWF